MATGGVDEIAKPVSEEVIQDANVADIPSSKELPTDEVELDSTSESSYVHYSCQEITEARIQYFWSTQIRPWKANRQLMISALILLYEVLNPFIYTVLLIFTAVILDMVMNWLIQDTEAQEVKKYTTITLLVTFYVYGIYKTFSKWSLLSQHTDQLKYLLENIEKADKIAQAAKDEPLYQYKDCENEDEDEGNQDEKESDVGNNINETEAEEKNPAAGDRCIPELSKEETIKDKDV